VPALLSFGAAPAPAHVTEQSGAFEVELGWGVEPPRVGADNFVEVTVAAAHGEPVAVPAQALSVEVVYGDNAVTLPLVPTPAPGALEAPLTPTRPGIYSFNVSGSVAGRALDVSVTCSESTFECVDSASGTEFPVEDPSAGELAARLSSEADRVEEASERADGARTLAILALALAVVALAVAVRASRRRGSR
jgi:hypothetical protein